MPGCLSHFSFFAADGAANFTEPLGEDGGLLSSAAALRFPRTPAGGVLVSLRSAHCLCQAAEK